MMVMIFRLRELAGAVNKIYDVCDVGDVVAIKAGGL